MARTLSMTTNDYRGHLRYYGYRSRQVFAIFDQVYGSNYARSQIIRVLNVQMGTGSSELDAAGAGNVDAIAIAPYFQPDQYDLWSTGAYQNISIEVSLTTRRRVLYSAI